MFKSRIFNFILSNQNLLVTGSLDERKSMACELSVLLGVNVYYIDVTKIIKTGKLNKAQNEYLHEYECIKYSLGKEKEGIHQIESLLRLDDAIKEMVSSEKKYSKEQRLRAIAKEKNLRGVYVGCQKMIEAIYDNCHAIILFDNFYSESSVIINNVRSVLFNKIDGYFLFAGSFLDSAETKNMQMRDTFFEIEL